MSDSILKQWDKLVEGLKPTGREVCVVKKHTLAEIGGLIDLVDCGTETSSFGKYLGTRVLPQFSGMRLVVDDDIEGDIEIWDYRDYLSWCVRKGIVEKYRSQSSLVREGDKEEK